jgi:iron complex outermembrane receptor protein/hemoglobin/transferrin/lactoferrin receptor protein
VSVPPRPSLRPISASTIAIGAWSLAARAFAAEPDPSGAAPSDRRPIEVFVVKKDSGRGAEPGRATSRVDRRDLEERLPRSAPDALRYEPGVFVQQSAHGQGSAFVRGRTGQQTVLLFDGIRVNTSTYRQGPNQYFFTIDSRTVHSIDLTRGGASTLHGSDALGGVLDARPVEPALDLSAEGAVVRPRAMLRFASADREFGERFQVDAQASRDVRFLGGAGYRVVGRLESGGPVRSPTTGAIPPIPTFEADGRTQLGTGFREVTGDGRLVVGLAPGKRLVAAAYAYRQYDAPRTDQCPPAYASIDECLTYQEQFRTLAYLAFDGDLGRAARSARMAVSYQRQHERRNRERPRSFVNNGGRDDVDTLGAMAKLQTEPGVLLPGVTAKLRYGGDVYADRVASEAWTELTDVRLVVASSRGQYLMGSRYAQGGAFAEAEVSVGEWLVARGGGRGGGAMARAPSDPESGTRGVDRAWPVAVGHAGLEGRPTAWLAVLGNVDRSFRAPNLDDLTSRQQTGPGFQFENAALAPETATTLEAGMRVDTRVLQADVWAYRSNVHDAITRVSRAAADCPASTPQCAGSWSRFQLVNVPGASTVDGVEVSARAWLPRGFVLRGTVAHTYGEGPNPQAAPSDPRLPYQSRVPLSRIPPLNGTFEARWNGPRGIYVGGGVRWAAAQTRLAPSDRGDARIPEGGTPGFAVVDLRGGFRVRRELVVAVVVENVGDAAHRYHGSSVNGPGRGVILAMEAGL